MRPRIQTGALVGVLVFIALAPVEVNAVGPSRDRVRLGSKLSFDRPPDELKLRTQARMTRLTEKDGRNPIDIFHVWGCSTDANFEVEEKYIDGDAPSALLSSILLQDSRRFLRLVGRTKVKKLRNKLGLTLHYGVLDVFATDDQAQWGPWRLRIETKKGRPARTGPIPQGVSGKRLKIYHLLIKDRAATRWEHVVVRADAATEKKHRKVILGILTSVGVVRVKRS